MAETSRIVFDYPTGWAAMEPTDPEQHHEQCSYRTQHQALLCDCAALAAARRAYELGVQHVREGRPVTAEEWAAKRAHENVPADGAGGP